MKKTIDLKHFIELLKRDVAKKDAKKNYSLERK